MLSLSKMRVNAAVGFVALLLEDNIAEDLGALHDGRAGVIGRALQSKDQRLLLLLQ